MFYLCIIYIQKMTKNYFLNYLIGMDFFQQKLINIKYPLKCKYKFVNLKLEY